jgi:hypothetical protein
MFVKLPAISPWRQRPLIVQARMLLRSWPVAQSHATPADEAAAVIKACA